MLPLSILPRSDFGDAEFARALGAGKEVLGKLAFSLGIALAWERPSNQPMQRMAGRRYSFTLK